MARFVGVEPIDVVKRIVITLENCFYASYALAGKLLKCCQFRFSAYFTVTDLADLMPLT